MAGEPGWVLLAADYSQIELRVLAHYSRRPGLCDAFDRDEDIHALVASQVYRRPARRSHREMRRSAKAVNFGIIYGQSPFGLAKGLGISQEEAAEFIETYFATYPGVVEFLVDTLDRLPRTRLRHHAPRPPPSDRRRPPRAAGPARAKTGALRQLNVPERTAVNAVIQGTAADLIKLAMIRIHRRLARRRLARRGCCCRSTTNCCSKRPRAEHRRELAARSSARNVRRRWSSPSR